MLQRNFAQNIFLLLLISINQLVLSENCPSDVFIADTTSRFVICTIISERRKQATPIMLCHLSDTFIILNTIPITCCLLVKAISVKLTQGALVKNEKRKENSSFTSNTWRISREIQFCLFQIKSDSGLAVSEITQYKMEELHPSMTIQEHIQFMENQFQLTVMWVFMMIH